MKQRIIIRADASKKTGYGHFVRSLALASYLKNNFECHFATFNSDNSDFYYNPTDYQLTQIEAVCEPMIIPSNGFDSYNRDFLNKIYSEDIVVLDNYYFSTQFQHEIKKKGCKLICIDDVHDRHMVCDLLITVCPLTRDAFSLESYTKFIGGIEWSFLRDPFLKPQKDRRSDSYNSGPDKKRIVVAMGGADAFNLTDKIIKVINEVFPQAEINAICGETVNINEESARLANIHRQISAEEIVTLFDNSDFGIFPASTICIEALSRKLPILAGYYVNNQIELYEYGIKHHIFSPLGNLLDESTEIANRLDNIIKQPCLSPIDIDYNSQKEKIIKIFKTI